jgi:hypothetical protein
MGLGGPQLQVENLTTGSTTLTLTDDQQGKLLVWNGQTSAARICLPQPETGMPYHIYFHSDAASSGTKIIATSVGAYDVYLIDGTTGECFAPADGSTVEGGIGVSLFAITDTRWIVDKWGASTLGFAATHGSTTT